MISFVLVTRRGNELIVQRDEEVSVIVANTEADARVLATMIGTVVVTTKERVNNGSGSVSAAEAISHSMAE